MSGLVSVLKLIFLQILLYNIVIVDVVWQFDQCQVDLFIDIYLYSGQVISYYVLYQDWVQMYCCVGYFVLDGLQDEMIFVEYEFVLLLLEGQCYFIFYC